MIKNEIINNVFLVSWAIKPANLLNEESLTEFATFVEEFVHDDNIRGMIITSENEEFILGADLSMLWKFVTENNAEALLEILEHFHKLLRTMEESSKPIITVINGNCIGGGYELALATNYRIAIKGQYSIGLPETRIGLFPGGGGSQRLPRMIGIQKGLEIMTQGKLLTPVNALKTGLIDTLAENKEEAIKLAFEYIEKHPSVRQPWDDNKPIPDGGVYSKNGMQIFTVANALARKNTWGNYPHIQYLLSSAYEGLQMQFDRALKTEAKYFVKTLLTKETKQMLKTLWFGINSLKKGKMRPENYPKKTFSRIGILGGGLMGAGIALVAIKNNIKAIVKDISEDALTYTKKYIEKSLQKDIEKYKITEAEYNNIISNLKLTTKIEDLADVQLVIEAVPENRELKHKVIKETEAILENKNVILASNTSTLPISSLAEASSRPENFIGLHFFSPVEKMLLLEIIVGEKTSEETLAYALDFAVQIKKIPIIVKDSRGFFTSRVFATYLKEGIAMLEEGIPAPIIEHAGKQAGMPLGPLELADAVGIDVIYNVLLQTEKDLNIVLDEPLKRIGKFMIEQNRLGKKTQKGFYEYKPEKHLWEELKKYQKNISYDYEELIRRLTYIQVVEALKVLSEGIVSDRTSIDVGSILGWGFPPFSGGVLSYIDFVGEKDFFYNLKELKNKYGERFSV